MTDKPLSEQVALLEDSRDFYRSARDELIDRCQTLEADMVTLDHDGARLRRELGQLRTENDELRRGQGRWPKLGPAVAPTVPRLIAADELESGAKVATFTDQGRPVAGTVTGEATNKVTLLLHNDNLMGFDTERTFILLKDAPQPEPEIVTAETIRASEPGTVWRDRNGVNHEWTGERLAWHPPAGGLGKGDFLTNGGFEVDGPWSRSTAAPRGAYDTPPRLTVHDLEVAPVGSVVQNAGGLGWTKTERGMWTGALGLQKWSSTELLTYADSDATLTYPGQS